MADNVVASDQCGQIIFYPEWNTLELRWLPSTRQATDGDVRDTMQRFCAEAETRKPSSLVVDTNQFGQWDDGMIEWTLEKVIPGFSRAGVQKFAFIAGPGYGGRRQSRAGSPYQMDRPISRPGGRPPGKAHTSGSPAES